MHVFIAVTYEQVIQHICGMICNYIVSELWRQNMFYLITVGGLFEQLVNVTRHMDYNIRLWNMNVLLKLYCKRRLWNSSDSILAPNS